MKFAATGVDQRMLDSSHGCAHNAISETTVMSKLLEVPTVTI